jgi:hypothetical protein
MTAAALQKFIYDALTTDDAVGYAVSGRVYDRAPANAEFPFISLGPTSVVLIQDDCLSGRSETVQVDIWSTDQAGKLEAKRITDLVMAALNGVDAELDDGYLTDLRVVLAQVIDDPDGITSHGIVQIEALVDEGG